jgi:hypothetical protein
VDVKKRKVVLREEVDLASDYKIRPESIILIQ